MIFGTDLRVISVGSVPSGLIEKLREEIEGCYRRLSAPGTVELRLIDTAEGLADLLAKEKAELGIATSGDEGFLAAHDAWRGVPRITVCVERIMGLPELLRQGIIRHEVAHTVLHGSLEYYIFRLSQDVLAKGRARGIGVPILQQLFYYVSVAVKDYEATKLLVEHGYEECQAALALHQLEVSEEDKLAWRMALWHPQARLVYLTAQLKPLLFARPLLELPTTAQRVNQGVKAMLEHLPPEERERLLKLVERVASDLGDDTHRNMEMSLRLVLETL